MVDVSGVGLVGTGVAFGSLSVAVSEKAPSVPVTVWSPLLVEVQVWPVQELPVPPIVNVVAPRSAARRVRHRSKPPGSSAWPTTTASSGRRGLIEDNDRAYA